MTPLPDASACVGLVVADVDRTLVTPDKVVTPLVTSSNTEEGSALAMERWVLPRARRMRPQVPDRIAPRSVAGLS